MLTALIISGVIASTPIVGLHRTATPVHASPGGPLVGSVRATEPATGEQTVLPVIASKPGWLRVRLPYRPDGATGWISMVDATLSTTPWAVYINRAERKARIFLKGRLKHTYPIIVGRPSLPTPTGTFFVTEIMEDRGEVTGPYALATSAFSNVLQEFDGGPGQVAMHGREGLSDPISTASSHGCIRFEASAITWMAWNIEVGSPVIIH